MADGPSMTHGRPNSRAVYVDTAAEALELQRRLDGASSAAVDCEAAGFHRYSDRICLVQISVGERNYVLDPLALRLAPHLKPFLESREKRALMHGADFDLRLLRRDLGIRTRGLFDTQVAAEMLGEPRTSLQALLEKFVGVQVSKRFQRADWARRPLSREMIEYAASDTRHLRRLASALEARLNGLGRAHWVREECRRLETTAKEDPAAEAPADPVARVRGAHRMDPRSVTALRALIAWRDDVARALDRAPFRVVSNAALLEVARTRPRSIDGLTRVREFPANLAQRRGRSLLNVVRKVAETPENRLTPYPAPRARRRPPDPAELAAFDRVKRARNGVAERIGLDRGRVMANDALRAVVAAGPADLEALAAVDDVRAWQVELLGRELLDAL